MAAVKDQVDAEMARYRVLQEGGVSSCRIVPVVCCLCLCASDVCSRLYTVIGASAEVQVLATQRQQYAQQANENTMVKKVRSLALASRLREATASLAY